MSWRSCSNTWSARPPALTPLRDDEVLDDDAE